MNKFEAIINAGFENIRNLTLAAASWELKDAVQQVLTGLDLGKVRVAEKIDGKWVVHQWLKKAVLLSFVLEQNKVIDGGYTNYFDKVPSKYSGRGKVDFEKFGVRVVPPATARRGSYIAPNVVLMPSFVNIGAYVDSGTMVDTWVTVGSCAQIGKNVHLSGGVGIGGVLEPLQASPTIIEDNCFIGARSEVVEGVIVGEGSVISMGVYIGQSPPVTVNTVFTARLLSNRLTKKPAARSGSMSFCVISRSSVLSYLHITGHNVIKIKNILSGNP